jgi:hypothetical protein
MSKRPIHPARKILRHFLLAILVLSVGFLSMMVTLRMQYRGDKPIEGAMQVRVFQFDILQHQALAYIRDDAEDMKIANQLISYGFYSPLYTQAGINMLSKKADSGYQPAVDRLAEIFPEEQP